jgi:acyl-CoA thioesterase I
MSRAPLATAAVLALAAAAAPVSGRAADAPPGCAAPSALTRIALPLRHAAARIMRRGALLIVAIGSSSTAGAGASHPAFGYPSRLAADLAERFPTIRIRVINRGRGGEDAPEEVARMRRDVVAAHPDLVIWQLGTNAVLRHDNLAADAGLIARGLAELKRGGGDVVLMDLQYAPRVLARPAYAAMERLIAEAAAAGDVGLFRRFALMRHWRAERRPGAAPAVGPDGLHMTDFGYACLAAELADALAANWRTQRSALAADTALPRATGSAAMPEPEPAGLIAAKGDVKR